jgi:ATP-dependent helicase/nuclease subunit A
MDLMVLADALLLADDDLALATALKSPLFGLTTTTCSRIARKRRLLREALRRRSEPRFVEAAERPDRATRNGRGAKHHSASSRACSARKTAAANS